MNAESLKRWPVLDIVGIASLLALSLVLVFGRWEMWCRSITLGSLASLPWIILAARARVTKKRLFKITAILIPLAIGLFFIGCNEAHKERLVRCACIGIYFVSLFASGWLLLKLYMVILRVTTRV